MRPAIIVTAAAFALSGCMQPEPTLSEIEDRRIQSVGEQSAQDAMADVDASDFDALE